ncbi:MAG: VWA domain-containing protein [Planctomycetia bacterium]|nr:VWA domain-containing protein [Planctomycetia bacterium]
MSIFLERPFWLILIFVLIPLWLYWRKGLTRQSRLRSVTILTLRCTVVLLLVTALVGPVVTWRNYSKYVVCAVDVSGSVPEYTWRENPTLAGIADAAKLGRGNQCIFLPFARTPGVMANSWDEILNRPENGCDTQMTDLAAALGAASALAPEDYVPEVILFTDGMSNLGAKLNVETGKNRKTEADVENNTEDCETPSVDTSIPINVVQCSPVGKVPGTQNGTENGTQSAAQAETWITRFVAPVSAYEGEVVGMDLFVNATQAVGELKIDLQRNGELVETQTLIFEKPGVRGVRFQVPVVMMNKGDGKSVTEWKATISPDAKFDLLPQNNTVSAVTQIVPHQKILLVERVENLGDMLRSVLKKEFIEVETCIPENMPTELEKMREYGLVILSNIPAARIPAGTFDVLNTYVSEDGGGLLVIGGDQAFTSGGYRGTQIEKMLPVLCIPDENRPREGLALVLVVDRSGSMEGEAIALARDAVKGAMNVLGPQDQVGVHIYADSSQWIVPIRDLTEENREKAFTYIDKITAKGGTNMNLALEKSARALEEVSAERKHIILMTDGISIPADFMETARKIQEAGISISTIALGSGAEPNLLADMAKVGDGNAYVCVEPGTMPVIFEAETVSAAKIGVVEARTPVRQISSIPGFLNFNFTRVPPLLGYVQTAAKPESRVIFASEKEDPILAWWKFGRGKVMAFTSDMESPQWLQTWRGGWPDFDRFWGRLIAHTIRKDALKDFQIQMAFRGEWLNVTLKAPTTSTLDGMPELKITGEMLTSESSLKKSSASETLAEDAPRRLLPVAPGVYGTRVKIEPGRKYDLTLTATVDGRVRTWSATTLQSLTDEFLPDRQEDMNTALVTLAQSTGGSLKPDLATIFPTGTPTPDARFVLQTFPVWRFFLLLAVIGWLVELGFRRAKS